MKEVIEEFKDVVIQIATPFGTGTGFYLKDHNVIVTNKHVIQGTREAVINGRGFDKTVTEVMFTDPVHDIAFLKPPNGIDAPNIRLSENERVSAGEQIIAIGHPYGLKYTTTQGIVSKSERLYNGVNYVQIDAAINPGNSGGPLLNNQGEIVGVNTFIIADGDNLGFAVPSNYLREALSDYKQLYGQPAIRCGSCSNVITHQNIADSYCPSCGNKLSENDYNPKPYTPVGASKVMEDIITELGKDVRLSRVGSKGWDIEEGSALIKVDYNPKTRFIIGDAHLCKLPKDNIAPLYEYLLRENYKLEGIVFSVNNRDIILSLLIYDEDFNKETGLQLFKNLFQKADDYDDILIDQYGCLANTKEED